MFAALILSLRQLDDRVFVRVLLQSLAITLVLFVALGAASWWLARSVAGQLGAGGWQELAGIAAVLVAILGAWLLFRAIAVAVIGMFGDQIVRAVEARHYPDQLARARDLPFGPSLTMALGSAGRAIGLNLLMTPIYLGLLITGVGLPVAFFLVNSWLLGRDLVDMVAVRHLPQGTLPAWRKERKGLRLALGAAGTALFLIPILNLVAPILGAALATHLFHRRSA